MKGGVLTWDVNLAENAEADVVLHLQVIVADVVLHLQIIAMDVLIVQYLAITREYAFRLKCIVQTAVYL